MSHHRCCCGPGEPEPPTCANPPACIDAEFSGIDFVTACDNMTFNAAGMNGRFRLNATVPGSLQFQGEFPFLLYATQNGSQLAYISLMQVNVFLVCVGTLLEVQRVTMMPYRLFPFPGNAGVPGQRANIFTAIGSWAFPFTSINNFEAMYCATDTGTYPGPPYQNPPYPTAGIFGGGSVSITVPDSCAALPETMLARHCGGTLPDRFADVSSLPSSYFNSIELDGELYQLTEYVDEIGETVTFSTTACTAPSSAMMAPATSTSSGPQKITRNATQQMRSTGLVSEAELEAMGFDPDTEANAAKQGGCCGTPSKE